MLRPRNTYTTRHEAQAGFTLMEMMIVIVIIGISAALAAPSVRSAMAERRHMEAAADFVMLARQARSESAAYGRAYLIRFDGTNGIFSMYRGTSSNCSVNDWDGVGAGNDIIAASDCLNPANPGNCVNRTAATSTGYTVGGEMQIAITEASTATDIDMCWQPSGTMLWRTGGSVGAGGPFTDRNTINGGFLYTFNRIEGGSPVGVARRVIVPLSGQARLMR